jgi:hypothetical protein
MPRCRVYERGISLFKYPHVRDIWTTYLTQVRCSSHMCLYVYVLCWLTVLL